MSSSAGSAGDGGLRCVISSQSSSASSQHWTDEGRAGSGVGASEGEAQTLIDFRVLLRQNKEQLDEVFREVSDPTSSRYGQYLNNDQLRELVSPSVEDQSKVVRFLLKALQPLGSDSATGPKLVVESQGDYIQVRNASIPAVERTFGCEMHRFREMPPPTSQNPLAPAPAAFTPRVLLRCTGEVSVPVEFAGLVTGVSGLADFPPLLHGGPHPHPIHLPIVTPIPSSKQPQQQGQKPMTIPVAFDQTAAQQGANGVSAPVAAAAAPTPVQHPFHPHQTLRTVEQLRHVALDFEREQEEQKKASK